MEQTTPLACCKCRKSFLQTTLWDVAPTCRAIKQQTREQQKQLPCSGGAHRVVPIPCRVRLAQCETHRWPAMASQERRWRFHHARPGAELRLQMDVVRTLQRSPCCNAEPEIHSRVFLDGRTVLVKSVVLVQHRDTLNIGLRFGRLRARPSLWVRPPVETPTPNGDGQRWDLRRLTSRRPRLEHSRNTATPQLCSEHRRLPQRSLRDVVQKLRHNFHPLPCH